MRPEPCKVQGCGLESIVVQGIGPESNGVQSCHAPFVVHGQVRLPAGRQGLRIEKYFWM